MTPTRYRCIQHEFKTSSDHLQSLPDDEDRLKRRVSSPSFPMETEGATSQKRLLSSQKWGEMSVFGTALIPQLFQLQGIYNSKRFPVRTLQQQPENNILPQRFREWVGGHMRSLDAEKTATTLDTRKSSFTQASSASHIFSTQYHHATSFVCPATIFFPPSTNSPRIYNTQKPRESA